MSSLILASASPRRRELLTAMGVEFEVVTVPVTELDALTAPGMSAAELAEANALLKARAVGQPGRWILGADTVVALGGAIFGKPASIVEAHDFLRALSGKTHEVITGCALISSSGQTEVFRETTQVTFRVLSDETIAAYVREVAVLDKAGAYALQEKGERLIERVEGSRTNVIGLPVERLTDIFRRRGLLQDLNAP